MRQALELDHRESRQGMVQMLTALVRNEDRLMLTPVPASPMCWALLPDQYRRARLDAREPVPLG